MNTHYLISGVSGMDKFNYSQGGLIAILAVIMVFLILGIIIVLTELIGNTINKVIPANVPQVEAAAPVASAYATLNLNDEDATVAALVASIDYRNETKKNIRVVSIKEVK